MLAQSTDDGVSFSRPVNVTAQLKGRYAPGRGWQPLPATNWWAVG